MEPAQKCDICGTPTDRICGKCHLVYYCTGEHQKTGWKTHKKICRPYKLCDNEELGRYVVATKTIPAGTVIFKESPLVWGPPHYTPSVCLGCLKLLDEGQVHPCPKCGWPLCSEECQNEPSHKPECYYTTKGKGKVIISNLRNTGHHILYFGILALRCLYQSRFVPKIWEKFNDLESHCDAMNRGEDYETDFRLTRSAIRNFFQLPDEFTEQEIKKVCGVIMVNGFAVPMAEPNPTAVYHQASLLEHSCRENCFKVIARDGHLKMVAGVQIEKGERLSICYTLPLLTTIARQRYLRDTKLFTCKCDRCLDVTEFGTNFSSLKCQMQNCTGVFLPTSFLVRESPWICNNCKAKMEAKSANKIFERAEKSFDELAGNEAAAYKTFLESNERLFHEKHSFMINAKLRLIFKIDHETEGGLEQAPDEDLTLMANFCRQLREVLQIIAPAQKQIMSDVLSQLQRALKEISGRKEAAGELSDAESIRDLRERQALLEEALQYTKHEPGAAEMMKRLGNI